MKVTKTKKAPLIILTAGGTGGHIYPAESLAEELTKRGYRLALITDSRGKDNYKGKLGEITNYAVCGGALVGKSKLFKIKSLIKTFWGIIQASFILLRQKPVCVVGFGGYASFPCCFASILLGIDLVIHEQNSVMSRTNRLLSKHADLIGLSFKKTKFTPKNIKTVLTGMPIRKSILEVREQPYPTLENKDSFNIIVLGGSQGAKIFSDILPEAIKSLSPEAQKKIKIFQQARQADVETLKENYHGVKSDITISHFFNNMPELYSQAHLIVSRAGASSVCEITAVGLPSILVPLPIAADDHQTFNALDIVEAKAGLSIKQDNFTADFLSKTLIEFMNDYKKLFSMAENAKKASITDAACRFADAIEKEIISKKR